MANEPTQPGSEAEDADAMAAEWEKMAAADEAGEAAPEGAAAGGDGVPARVLNQDEIDSLLGFKESGAGGDDRSGIRAILDSSLVSYERLPMLEVVFDRLVRMMSTSLRNFTSDNVEVSLDNITSVRFGDYLNSIPLPAMMAVYQAKQWDNYGLLTVDSALIYSIVDVLLGGRRGTAAMRIEGRPYTTIERNLVERMIHLVLSDLSGAFEPLCPVNFNFERLETNPRFATIARPGNAAILARLRIDMDDRGGRLEIMLPYATIEPVREVLLQMFMGEKFGRDSIWENHLANELKSTDVQIEAVLDELTMSLREVMNWKVGTQVLLNSTPQSPIDLRCGDVTLFSSSMGRKGLQVAVKIDQRVMKRDELE
ncbi:MAG: flagellar motor switch protein FliM [Alphaproteobacteria bacterium]|nr:flagellar motor switch protein FliM [Alphaproteobacteria bacterium]